MKQLWIMKHFWVLALAAIITGCQQKEATVEKPAEAHADEHTGKDEHAGEKAEEHGGAITLSDAAKKSAGIRVEAAALRSLQATQDVPGIIEIAADRAIKVTPSAPGKLSISMPG